MILTNTRYIDGVGFVHDKYMFDENKTGYEIKFKNGNILRQIAPFSYVEDNWNDGRYVLFAAPFENTYGDINWYCPADLLSFVIKHKIIINGIERI